MKLLLLLLYCFPAVELKSLSSCIIHTYVCTFFLHSSKEYVDCMASGGHDSEYGSDIEVDCTAKVWVVEVESVWINNRDLKFHWQSPKTADYKSWLIYKCKVPKINNSYTKKVSLSRWSIHNWGCCQKYWTIISIKYFLIIHENWPWAAVAAVASTKQQIKNYHSTEEPIHRVRTCLWS